MFQNNTKRNTPKERPARSAKAPKAAPAHAAPKAAAKAPAPDARRLRSKPVDIQGRRRFPESSSPYRQLQLLLAGSMPLVRQKAGGAAYRLRSLFSALVSRARDGSSGHRLIQTAVFLTAGLVLMIFAANRVLYTTATTLSFEGRTLGTVASEEEAQAAVKSVESSISRVLGSSYSLEPDKVSYTTGLAYRGELMDEADLEAALSESLRVVEHGYA